jgi:hypothetical protein
MKARHELCDARDSTTGNNLVSIPFVSNPDQRHRVLSDALGRVGDYEAVLLDDNYYFQGVPAGPDGSEAALNRLRDLRFKFRKQLALRQRPLLKSCSFSYFIKIGRRFFGN